MINRGTPEYNEDVYRVKIGHAFLEKGYDIKGVVHVGANDGYEVQYYLKLGIERVMCFEPYKLAIDAFKEKYKDEIASRVVTLYEMGLGKVNEFRVLNYGPADGQNSSFLEPNEKYKDQPNFRDVLNAVNGSGVSRTMRFDNLLNLNQNINIDEYDCLVVDVQGMELDVLEGMGDYITRFKFLNIECSREAVYEGGADAQKVIDYLRSKGFAQVTPIEEHNDIFFIRRDINREEEL